jgi:hypothetical protein
LIDWALVKQVALWNYEDLIDKMLKVLSYKFTEEYYNHNMEEAKIYAKNLLTDTPKHQKLLSTLITMFSKFETAGMDSYSDLIHRIETREKCEHQLKQNGFPFADLIFTLNFVFRWILPFRNVYVKQLANSTDALNLEYFERLGELNIKFNLDIIETCRTKEKRQNITNRTAIPEAFLIDLTNKADLTRLPFTNWKTANQLFEAGYKSLNQLSEANLKELKTTMKKYFEGKGIKLGPFIDLEGINRWANCVPRIIKN